MLYRIVQDMPGRLRLRANVGTLSKEQACALTHELAAIPGVERAHAASANASVLVVYDPHSKARDAALAQMDAYSVLSLPEEAPDASFDMAAEDVRFYTKIASMALGRAARRFLLPPQVRMALAIVQSAHFISLGLRSLVRGQLTVEVLDATAITVSLLQRNFDSASSVMSLLRISEAMQDHVNARTRIALEESLLARADCVWAVDEDGNDYEIQLSEVVPGQLLRVRMGQSMPVDGTVVEGDAHLNESSMTGEAALVHKHAGSSVFAGTVVEEGSVVVRTTSLPGSSRIDQIVRLVEDSSELKAKLHSRAERLADTLVPFSFAGFFAVLALTRNLTKATSVLMVDYSCAIKLSMPVAVMSAMREASNVGAVIKGGKYLEALAQADVVVFDKTGTLTTETPTVEKVIALGRNKPDQVLRLAACLEEHYPHSIATAIVKAARHAGLAHDREMHAEVEYLVAHGIVSSVDGHRVMLGSAHFIFEDEGVPVPKGLRERIEREAPGSSVVYMARDHKLIGAVCINDPVREEAAEVLARLRQLGITRQVMLTGDSQISARAMAEQLGLDDYRAQVLPEDKARYVEELKAAGHTVVMVGDGINDSPALAAADVSVALNDASDIARAVADVSVLGSSLESLVTLRTLSQRLMARINTNYRFIVGFNTALIVGGVAGFIAPTLGAYLHNISTVAITAANTRPLLKAPEAQHAEGSGAGAA